MSRNDQRRQNRQERAQTRADSRRAQRVIQARQARRKRMLTIIGGVAGAAVIIAGLLLLFNRDPEPAAADEPVTEAPAPQIEVPAEGRFKGDPEAPVKVVEYGDFQ
jgi:hypothetical protein